MGSLPQLQRTLEAGPPQSVPHDLTQKPDCIFAPPFLSLSLLSSWSEDGCCTSRNDFHFLEGRMWRKPTVSFCEANSHQHLNMLNSISLIEAFHPFSLPWPRPHVCVHCICPFCQNLDIPPTPLPALPRLPLPTQALNCFYLGYTRDPSFWSKWRFWFLVYLTSLCCMVLFSGPFPTSSRTNDICISPIGPPRENIADVVAETANKYFLCPGSWEMGTKVPASLISDAISLPGLQIATSWLSPSVVFLCVHTDRPYHTHTHTKMVWGDSVTYTMRDSGQNREAFSPHS